MLNKIFKSTKHSIYNSSGPELLQTVFKLEFFFRIIRAGLPFFTLPILMRMLSPANFGLFTLCITSSALLVRLSSLGVTDYVCRKIGRGKPGILLDKMISGSLTLILRQFAWFALPSFFLVSLLTGIDWELSLVTVLLSLGQMLFEHLSICLKQRFYLQAYYLVTTLLTILIGTSIILGFIFEIQATGFYLFCYSVSYLICFAILFWIASDALDIRYTLPERYARLLRRGGRVAFLSSAGGWLFSMSDKYLIKWLSSADSLGHYGAVQTTLLGVANSLFLGIAVSLQAIFAKYRFDNKQIIDAKNKYLLGFGLFVFIILWPASLLSKYWVPLYFGNNFIGSEKIVPIVAAGIFIQFLNMPLGDSVMAKTPRSQLGFSVCALIAGVVNLVMNFYLIPSWGAEGAALSGVISFLLPLFYSLFLSIRLGLPIKVEMTMLLGVALMWGTIYV